MFISNFLAFYFNFNFYFSVSKSLLMLSEIKIIFQKYVSRVWIQDEYSVNTAKVCGFLHNTIQTNGCSAMDSIEHLSMDRKTTSKTIH